MVVDVFLICRRYGLISVLLLAVMVLSGCHYGNYFARTHPRELVSDDLGYGTERLVLQADDLFVLTSFVARPKFQQLMDNAVASIYDFYSCSPTKGFDGCRVPHVSVYLYTDDLLSSQAWEKMNAYRLDTVLAYLWSKGIPVERMSAKLFDDGNGTFGDLRYADISRLNRRVEFLLQ